MNNFPFSREEPLLLVGCGNMGGALARGWIKAGLNREAFLCVDPHVDNKQLDGLENVQIYSDLNDLPNGFIPKAIVVAVKPQLMPKVLPSLKSIRSENSLIISIAAGTSIAQFEEYFGKVAIIRAMPNTPAAVGKAITGMVANEFANPDDLTVSEYLLRTIGEVVWIEEEAMINTVTAVSGSGPAYVFYLVEALAAAGISNGLSHDQAMKLARKTIIGAGALLESSPDSAEELRKRVTSPNGTTAAALDILMADDGLAPIIRNAVNAAKHRSEELL